MIARRPWAVSFVIAGLVGLTVLYIASPAGGTQPFNPTFEITAISSQAPGAQADITFRTTLPAGDHALGNWSLDLPHTANELPAPDDWGLADAVLIVIPPC